MTIAIVSSTTTKFSCDELNLLTTVEPNIKEEDRFIVAMLFYQVDASDDDAIKFLKMAVDVTRGTDDEDFVKSFLDYYCELNGLS